MGELGFRDDNLLKIKKVDVNVDWSKIMHFCPTLSAEWAEPNGW